MQYRIGIDAGGTKVAYGLFDADHALVDRFQHATPITADGPAFCDLVIESLHRLLQKNNIGVDSLQGIGICMPSFTSVRYVRVYSAVLFNAGIFGETSAEVCGLYVANGTGSTSISKDLVVKNSANVEVPTTNMGVSEIASGTVNLSSEAEYVYVNGTLVEESTYSFTISAGQMVQIITQDGNESPYITVLKGV